MVQRANCTPIAGALLDFWQADEKGNYDNTGKAELMQQVETNFVTAFLCCRGAINAIARVYRRTITQDAIVVTNYAGKRGHPAVYSAGLVEILKGTEGLGLNTIARVRPECVIEVQAIEPPPSDINTPDDYERLTGRRPE